MQKGYSSALALEQQVRCGMEEHIHTDECYINHVLVCGQKAHTHSGDCYLLLLEQNDVNMLLSEMENSEDKSLESLLTGTVNEAIQLNQLVSAEPLPKNDNQLTVSEITTLNNVIEENQLNPAVVLNENAGVAMIDTLAVDKAESGNELTPLLLENPTEKLQNHAYFYLHMDGDWRYIGNLQFSTGFSKKQPWISAAIILDKINESVELNYGDFRIVYESSHNNQLITGATDVEYDKYYDQVYLGGIYPSEEAANVYKDIYIIAAGGTSKDSPLKFWSVTYNYANGDSNIIYVRDGASVVLPAGYAWEYDGGKPVISETVTIHEKTVFTEHTSATLTLDYLDKEDVQITFDTQTETTLPDDAIWLDEDGNRADGTILMNSSKTFYEACKVTLNYLNGTSQTQYVKPGNEIMLPAEHNWIDETENSAADTVTVWNHAVFTETYPDKTVTYIDMEDSSNNMEVNVAHGGSHVVRDGAWYEGSTVYYGGDVISNITRDITLIGNARLNLYYDLNFPTYNEMWITYNGTEPTLAGLTTQTCTDQITPVNSQVTLRNVSSREVFALVNSGNGMNRSIYFAGWSVNGDKEHLIEPGTIFRWDELYAMLDGGGNTIKLEGVWEYDSSHTVSFFIRYDSATYDTNGNIVGDDPNNYTKEVFNGHLFADPNSVFSNSASTNTSLYAIASDTSENSVEIDTKIRSLYGSGLSYTFEYTPKNNVTFYMKSFPDDADVIAKIKDQVQANGKQIYADDGFGKKELIEDLNDLDTNHFTIRWYVFKQEGDAWHVDGKLVKKVGTIHVSKTFGGNENLVSQVKAATGEKQFHITATNGERTETMYLTDKDVVYNAATDTYIWTISKVNYNERWTITEHNSDSVLNDAVGLEEWVTVDTYNGTSNSGDGNSTTVVGVTHAADTVNDEWLRADFTNVYHMGNTLLVRKVDGETGKPLAGATFQLEQNGEVMRFSFNEDNDAYEWDQENGTVLQLSTSENGYLEVIDNFTYEAGAVTVREISTPKGYSAAGEVVLNYTGTEGKREVAIINDVTIIRKGRETEYATYQAGVLTVNNYSDTISVTAEKIWNCGEEYYRNLNAEVQLYADGKLVSSVIPGTSDHTVLLTPSNGYSYTWDGLPAYANGSKIDWSIKETAIGNASGGYEMADSKGIFPNWIASYTNPRYGTDGDGFETVLLQVHNDVKRTLLRLTKYNGSKSQLLAGAEFELTAVDNDGNAISGIPSKIGITDDNGLLIFDNLKYATRYRLKEIGAPDGYFAYSQPAYLTIGTDGTVTVEEHSYVSAGTAAYNITVINRSAGTLPNTGGAGTLSYTLGGLLLMLAAASLFVYKKILTKKVK
jgi:LPXTG-motif cell wall-anchored protein